MSSEQPFAALTELRVAAGDFLQALEDAGFVQGVKARPRVNPRHTGLSLVQFGEALRRFAHAVNPRWLQHDDPGFHTQTGVSPAPSAAWAIESLDSKCELHDGLEAILAHWKADGFWGCLSFSLGGTPGPGTFKPGHFHFPDSEHGLRPVPRHIFEAMTEAVERLRLFPATSISHPSGSVDSGDPPADVSAVRIGPRFAGGILTFDGVVVAKFRGGTAQGKRTVPFLQAFEQAGWPESDVQSPGGLKGKALRDTLKYLNEKLGKAGNAPLRFVRNGLGTGCRWEPVKPRQS
jgi:hypothetical protein